MKLLFIGAHQDDCEICFGGLALKAARMGHEVRFLSLTNGGGGHHLLSPEETIATRAKESAAVAAYMGIRYDVWDIPDANLVPDLAARKRLIRYIREFAPDLIMTHRPNDYHPDHRATGQLVMDASYLLIVPNECPDTPALRRTPVIAYGEDNFRNPPFRADLLVDISDVIEDKYKITALNESQVYEWLPYADCEEVPADPSTWFDWLIGQKVTEATTDEEVLAAPRGYGPFYAKTAARFRQELIAKYGPERGAQIRFAEAYEICEYSGAMTEAVRALLSSL